MTRVDLATGVAGWRARTGVRALQTLRVPAGLTIALVPLRVRGHELDGSREVALRRVGLAESLQHDGELEVRSARA